MLPFKSLPGTTALATLIFGTSPAVVGTRLGRADLCKPNRNLQAPWGGVYRVLLPLPTNLSLLIFIFEGNPRRLDPRKTLITPSTSSAACDK